MYGAELAEIYDLVYVGRGKDYRQEAKDIAELIRARNPVASSLLDVGCGTGAHLVCFDREFDEVAGLELSPAMVSVAGGKLDRDVVHEGDMRNFALGETFDAITCMFSTIAYALTESDLGDALGCFEAHLAPGGVVVVEPWWFEDTFIEGYVAGDVCTGGSRTVARVSHAARNGDRSRMNVHYVVAEPGRGVWHFEEVHVSRLYTRAQYEAAFHCAGLTPEYLPGGPSGRGLFVGTRDR